MVSSSDSLGLLTGVQLMDIGKGMKGLFRKGPSQDLLDEEKRALVIEEAFKNADEQKEAGAENWSESLQALLADMLELGANPDEYLKSLAHKYPEETSFRQPYLEKLFPKAHIDQDELFLLEIDTAANPIQLRKWTRLFEEANFYDREKLLPEMHTKYVRAVAKFFPPEGESQWLDVDTEPQARSMFFNFLDQLSEEAVKNEDHGEPYRTIVELALEYFPDRTDLLRFAAYARCKQNNQDDDTVEIILKVLVHYPNDTLLKAYAGQMLFNRHGHEDEGIAMLTQAWEESPENKAIRRRLVDAIRIASTWDNDWIPLLNEWIDANPEDEEIALVLANHYLDSEHCHTPEAVEAFERVVENDPHDWQFRLAITEAHFFHENWSEVIDRCEKLDALGMADESVNKMLAIAYAETGAKNEKAADFLREAVEGGTTNPQIHREYCKVLLNSDPDSLEAQEQFVRALRLDANNLYARLGLIHGDIKKRKYESALDQLVVILQDDPENEVALRQAGDIIAADQRRPYLRKVYALKPLAALKVFESARQHLSYSLVIDREVARYRIKLGFSDEKTEFLLRQICKRDSQDLEFRLARADILMKLGRESDAISLYREILTRVTSMSQSDSSSSFSLKPDDFDRIGGIVMQYYLTSVETPKGEDLDSLLNLALHGGVSDEDFLRIAGIAAESKEENQLILPILRRAQAFDPDDEVIERALIKQQLRRGQVRPAIQMAIRLIDGSDYSPETVEFLEEVVGESKRDHILEETKASILRLFKDKGFLPERITLGLTQLMIIGEAFEKKYIRIYDRAAQISTAPTEIKTALLRCVGGDPDLD